MFFLWLPLGKTHITNFFFSGRTTKRGEVKPPEPLRKKKLRSRGGGTLTLGSRTGAGVHKSLLGSYPYKFNNNKNPWIVKYTYDVRISINLLTEYFPARAPRGLLSPQVLFKQILGSSLANRRGGITIFLLGGGAGGMRGIYKNTYNKHC